MQGPNEEAEASISTANVRESPDTATSLNANAAFAVRRKGAKRTLPWALAAEELDLVSSPPSKAEIVPARKKSRLEEPISGSTDEADTKLSSHDTTAVSLPAADDDDDDDADDADNADADRTGKWTSTEDRKLKDAVQMHGGKGWAATIAALVPGRTKKQCQNRWHNVLDPNIDRANECTARWTSVEDSKLKNAVQTHSCKNWGAIASLVSGRGRNQCYFRWHRVLDPNIDRANECRLHGQKTKTSS
jgi:hypothetical protein